MSRQPPLARGLQKAFKGSIQGQMLERSRAVFLAPLARAAATLAAGVGCHWQRAAAVIRQDRNCFLLNQP